MPYSNNLYKANRHKGIGPAGVKCSCCRPFPFGKDKLYRRNIRAKNKVTTLYLIKEQINDNEDYLNEVYAEEWEFYDPFDEYFDDWNEEYEPDDIDDITYQNEIWSVYDEMF